MSNPNSDIFKYLEINDNQIKIKYDAFIPIPKEKTVNIRITTDRKGNPVNDAEITYKSGHQQEQKTTGNTITFKGEQLKENWKISARKSDYLYSKEVTITPENQNEDVTLVLEKHRKVKIVVTEAEGEKNNVLDFKVRASKGKCSTEKVDELTFKGDEIDKTYNITVEKNGYTRSTSQSYCPKDGESTIYFELEKTPKDSHSNNNSPHPAPEKGKELFYKNPKFISGSVVGLLVLGLGIRALCLFLSNDKTHPETPLTAQQITTYVEGDSLMFPTLTTYRDNWKNQEQDFIIESGGGFLYKLTHIFGGDKIVDSTKWRSDWQPAYESIERAITKRTLLTNNNFAKLKKPRYSSAQQKFKDAINRIDSINSEEVEQKLGDVSAFTLTQIADSINSILTLKKTKKNGTAQRR